MIASRRVDSVETVTAGSFHVAFSAMGGLEAKPVISYRSPRFDSRKGFARGFEDTDKRDDSLKKRTTWRRRLQLETQTHV